MSQASTTTGSPSAEAVLSLPATPKLSLAPRVLDWCHEFIRQPDGPDAGDPWRFTREQKRFLWYLYAVDDRGRFLWSRAVLRRAKGWGKSPVMAALGLAELCGPVRYDGLDSKGQPVGVAASLPWVQIAGVSEKQTTNTMSMVLAMIGESPIIDEYRLDPGLTRVFSGSGGRLEPITASAPTAEGARPTFCILDETHHWLQSNGGHKLAEVIRRNLGKSRDGMARSVETTNAHASGEDSVAERSYVAWQAISEGRSRSASLLYDAREAPGDVDMADEEQLTAGLLAAYGDSTWVDLERIRDEVWTPTTPPEDSRRFYLNQIASAVDSWISQPEWAGRADVTKVVADRDTITLGFDGSRSRARGITDATALIGCRVADGHLFEVGVWEQPAGPSGADWRVPVVEVEAAVADAFERFNVVGFFADPAKWESYIAGWEARYHRRLKVKASQNHPIEWWMTGGRSMQTVRALEQFHSAVVDGDLTHDGSFALTRHVLNARRRVSRSGIQIAKEHPDSPRKIDAAVAAVLAYEARLAALAAGVGNDRGFVPMRIR